MTVWRLSHRADPEARVLADRHYSRQSIGAPQFVPPGRCLVLVTGGAYWVTSWPFAAYVKHAWAGAWVCSAFRREADCPYRASDLIREAVAISRWKWPEVPEMGMVTFVDPRHVQTGVLGYCYRRAGFRSATPRTTKGGLLALQLLPGRMGDAVMPLGAQWELAA